MQQTIVDKVDWIRVTNWLLFFRFRQLFCLDNRANRKSEKQQDMYSSYTAACRSNVRKVKSSEKLKTLKNPEMTHLSQFSLMLKCVTNHVLWTLISRDIHNIIQIPANQTDISVRRLDTWRKCWYSCIRRRVIYQRKWCFHQISMGLSADISMHKGGWCKLFIDMDSLRNHSIWFIIETISKYIHYEIMQFKVCKKCIFFINTEVTQLNAFWDK